jgi:hypothetical protein
MGTSNLGTKKSSQVVHKNHGTAKPARHLSGSDLRFEVDPNRLGNASSGVDTPPSLPRRVLSTKGSLGDFVNAEMRASLSIPVRSNTHQRPNSDNTRGMHNAIFPLRDRSQEDAEPMAPPPKKSPNPFLDLCKASDKPPRRTPPGYLKVDRPPELPLCRRSVPLYGVNSESSSGLSALAASIRLSSSGNVTATVAATSPVALLDWANSFLKSEP